MNNILFNSISFPLISLIFIFLTIFLLLYRINNKENNKSIIYYYMILITIIVILFEMLIPFTIKNKEELHLLNEIVCRSYVFFSVAWTDILLYYMFLYNKEFENKKTFIFIILNLLLTIILCIFISPKFENINYYTITGPLAAFMHIWCAIMCIIEVILLITKKITVKNLNPIPLYVGAISYTGIVVYQILTGKYLNILSFMFTLIIVVLFYSAESQDEKLIEEYENQKKESEVVNEEKEKFLFNMSKEIRTPMSNIIGLCNIISLNENELSLDDIKSEGNKIHLESTKLLTSINNILDLARYEAKKEELIEKNYKFEELIFEINDIIINKYNICPNYKFDDNLPYSLYGDANKIKKIIDLIIEKEIREILIGKINMEFSCENSNNDDYNGIISLSIIYDGVVDKENENNNGIELEKSIIEKCCELLNCIVEEKNISEIKKEYTIRYTQKIIDERALENINSKIESYNNKLLKNVNVVNDYSDKRILVVDDDQININIIKRLFKKYNFTVDESLSGKKCIEMFKTNEYDMIFIDDMMPDLDGTQTLEELKKLNKKIPPIIVVTANSYDGLKEKYVDLGFTDYMAKPVNSRIINSMINKYLNEGGDK